MSHAPLKAAPASDAGEKDKKREQKRKLKTQTKKDNRRNTEKRSTEKRSTEKRNIEKSAEKGGKKEVRKDLKKKISKKKDLKKEYTTRELKHQGVKKKDLKKQDAVRKTASGGKSTGQKPSGGKNELRTSWNRGARNELQVVKDSGKKELQVIKDGGKKELRVIKDGIRADLRGAGSSQKAEPVRDKGRKGFGLRKKKDENKGTAPSVRIIPLGGLEQIGMNITAFEYGDSIVVVDCGLAFPEDDMLGIDLVIPDTTYLEDNIDKVKAFVITHGHEDHIGALPYVLKKINVPVYGTRLTIGIIENKLREHNLLGSTERHVVAFGDVVTLGDFQVEFIKTNHSIVDAAALAITSPAGTIVHTGDFKVDYTPVYGDAIDLQRFAELGRKGVLALMCDSTNSLRPGHTPSEKAVGRSIDQIFRDHQDPRLIVATFASNVDRVQQIINHAYKYGRKVVVEGRSMVNIIETATKLDVLNVPENTLIDIDQLKNYPGEKTVIITTGSQGESMAALSRMADGMHRKVTIGPNDTVIFSSSPIPGNEKAVTGVINKLILKGADVISQDVHASGHPCQEDVKLIYHLVQPRYAIPVHGEYRHLKAQAKLVKELGYDKDHIFILGSGDVLELSEDGAAVREKVQVGNIMVDGLGVGDVGNVVLRDRQHLAEDGIVIVAFALESGSCRLLSGPEITSRGFVYIKEADDLMAGAASVAEDAIERCQEARSTDWNRYKNAVKDGLNDFFWKKTQRRPVILPMILEI